MRRKLD
jgi:hypothetical protein